jgi:hypothetical protein
MRRSALEGLLGYKARPPYVLSRGRGNFLEIFHADSGVEVGHAHKIECTKRYCVFALGGADGADWVKEVNSPAEIIPAFISFLQANPRQWLREGLGRYTKFTDFGVLEIREHNDSGLWEVLRDGIHLWYRDEAPAVICGKVEAQGVADAHMSKGFLNSSASSSDNFEWKPDADPWWQSETSGTWGPRKASHPYPSDEISPDECSDQPTAPCAAPS